jgi:hypothetical protein
MAIVCVIMWLATEAGFSVAMSRVQESRQAPAFTLNDQHQAAHHYQFPRSKISVLIFADYAGSPQLENWIRPLFERYQESIAIDGVAELSKVPKLIRGMVRTAFRDRLERPVMLDWSGAVSTDYHYQKGQANLFVIDHSGRILLKIVGAISAVNLQRVQNVIDQQLNVNRP